MTLQIDSGNVVAVLHQNRYYLAYIQDIRETDVLIDFHCKTLAPAWISSQFVWPQMFSCDILDMGFDRDMQVAVRDEPGGPLLFRPGRVISDRSKPAFRSVIYVEWNTSSGMTSRTVILETQIMGGDPLPGRSLFTVIRGNAAKPFLKLILPLTVSCSLTAINSADLFELRQLIHNLLRMKARTAEFGYGGCYHNFHMTLAGGSVMFMFWERSKVIDHKQWTNDDITDVVSQWITHLSPASAGSIGEERNTDFQTTDSPFKFVRLPNFILYQVLNDLEIHDLVNARRVCRRWNNILEKLSHLTHIKIDLHRRRQMLNFGEYVWDFGVILDKLLHTHVKTLTILNVGNPLEADCRVADIIALSPVTSLAALRGVRFRAIALINVLSSAEICTGKWGKLTGNFGELMPITDLLIVRNLKLHKLMYPYYEDDPLFFETPAQLLQAQGIPTQRSSLPGLTIPGIRFDFRLPELDNFHTLLECMERCCPDILAKDEATARAVYRYLISAQLPQEVLMAREIAKKWKSFESSFGRLGDSYEAETSSLEPASSSKLFTYAVLSLFKIMT